MPSSAYRRAAQSYAEGVRALLAPATPSVTRQAATVARRSVRLREAAAGHLSAPDADERARASTRLLAHALTDLQVSAYLLGLAEHREAARSLADRRATVAAWRVTLGVAGARRARTPSA